MVRSEARTVAEYLRQLPTERRRVVAAIRRVVRANLPKGFVETMNWGVISYEVPLKRYPKTYNGQPLNYAAIAAQKNYYAIYLMALYQDAAKLAAIKREFAKCGKKLDMGKCCLRFKRAEDIPLSAIGESIAGTSVDEFLSYYEAAKCGREKK